MSTLLPHERLLVYQRSVALYEIAHLMTARVQHRHAHLADQLLRALSSVPLNIAEGATEFSRGDKIRFYRMALRSAGEAAAALDILRRSNLIDSAPASTLRSDLAQIIGMLTSLIQSHSRHRKGKGKGEGEGGG